MIAEMRMAAGGAGGLRPSLAERFADVAPRLYLILALPGVLLLAILVPPFQAPDEFAQAYRVYQVSRGGWIGQRLSPEASGGFVDTGLVEAARPFHAIAFHPERKVSLDTLTAARDIGWSGILQPQAFSNSALYGPLFYVPQALGLRLGEAAGLGVLDSLSLARLAGGLTACLVAFAALRLCRRGLALMFTVLLLPMTQFMFASVAQDGLLIASSCWMIALASATTTERRPARAWELLVFLFLLAAGGMARPPHLLFALLLPLLNLRMAGAPRSRRPGWRAPAIVLAPALVVGWLALAAPRFASLRIADGVSAPDQIAHLLADPVRILRVAWQTLLESGGDIAISFIGQLGWLDTSMPGIFYALAAIALVAALLADAAADRTPAARPADSPRARLLPLLLILGVATLTAGLIYVTFTPLDHPIVQGLQGRYLLSVAPLLAWLMPAVTRPRVAALAGWTWIAVAALPLVTLVVMPWRVVARYYLT